MKNSKTNLFWVSFSDILLSLLFVTIVLFIFTFLKLKQKNSFLTQKVEKLAFLEQVEERNKKLKSSDAFIYLPDLKKFIFKEKVTFAYGSSVIPKDSENNLLLAGKQISELFQSSSEDRQSGKEDFKYLLILEGSASKYAFTPTKEQELIGFRLSYSRALAVFDYWREKNIRFNSEIVEVLISGSGILGSIRSSDEAQNQSIMVQIIPKNIPEYANIEKETLR